MSKKVLIIEDTFQTQKILTATLGKRGYEVYSATLGQEGLEVAKVKKPDLILLDIMLIGDFSGLEVLENLKKDPELKDIPVVVLTNLDNQEEIAQKLGANDYLVKANISLQDIIEKVDSYF